MIVVVTGASRGAGKGIALALGAAGATVYATGRSTSESDTQWGGTIHETAELVATIDPGVFWEQPLEAGDLITVGLRSHYVASYYAAPLLIANGRGLIVNTGHYGSVCYFASSWNRVGDFGLVSRLCLLRSNPFVRSAPSFRPDLQARYADARSGGQGWPAFGPSRQRREASLTAASTTARSSVSGDRSSGGRYSSGSMQVRTLRRKYSSFLRP
jgi:NAD(P)-dependent dehydrogenase (short-subunit alcohol dehydrogenase family)